MQNITLLELVPIVIALAAWGTELTNAMVKVHTDNEALHFVINKQYSKEEAVKNWIRKLVTLTLKHNILLKACHISGKANYLADHLSRLEVCQFLAIHQTAENKQTQTPNLNFFAENEKQY